MAKSGLIEAIAAGIRFFRTGASTNYVGLKPPTTDPATSFDLTLFNALPGSTQAITVSATGQLGTQALGGGGTVTSVALTAPAFLTVAGSPITGGGTLALTLASQTANTVFAAPSGSAGAPTFRAMVFADISSLIGTTASTIAAGNDTRFHNQNTDTGTTAVSFQLNSGSSGVRLKDVAGVLVARNSGDTANADLTAANVIVAGNLTVQGTTTTVNSETVTIDDNIIVLNNNVTTGTPTEDGGIQIRRGSSTSASLIWDETSDFWKAGVVASEQRLARHAISTFTNATLTAGILTFTHALDNQYPSVFIVDNNGKRIASPDDITHTSATVATVDLTSFGTLTGTWRAVAVG